MIKNIFKYKNGIYVLNEDIEVKRVIKLKSEDGKIYDYLEYNKIPVGIKLESKEYYVIKKGYFDIDIFETEEDAQKTIEEIYNSLEEVSDYIEKKSQLLNCCCSLDKSLIN